MAAGPAPAGSPDLRSLLLALRGDLASILASLDGILAMLDHAAEPSDLLRPREVADRLGLGASTVYDLIARGDLPSVRIGRSVRVPRAAVEARQRLTPLPPAIPRRPPVRPAPSRQPGVAGSVPTPRSHPAARRV